ncbi:unnamed protein product [Angiostrongylus costaricensis]|uniref:Tnp_DNA_bind domain-containing protein n=1 Tax=Angiostrongylus costaricensis TaxID=334426 RepID=A0A0R3PM75_ANGCS|nr:unnamed protein product [Angiostrongylus costaricensis]
MNAGKTEVDDEWQQWFSMMMTRDQRMVFGRETITLRLRAAARAIAVLQPSVARRRFAVTVRRASSICCDRPSPAIRLPPPSASRVVSRAAVSGCLQSSTPIK